MKKIVCFLACVMALSCTVRQSDGALVTGKVDVCPDTGVIRVRLSHWEGSVGRQYMVDTLRNGRFRFKLDTLPSGSGKFTINIDRDIYEILCLGPEVYLEPGVRVRIKGLAKHYYTARIRSNVKDQKLRQRFLSKVSREDWDHYQDLFVDRYSIVNKSYYDQSISEVEKDSLNKLSNRMLKQSDSISDIINLNELRVMASEQPGQYWMDRLRRKASGLSHGMYAEYRPIMEKLYESLPEELKLTSEGMEIQEYLNPVKKLHAGDTLSDYRYVDREGREHLVKEFRGRRVLLDFWSRGCRPCMESMPVLKRLNADYADQLSIISINLNTAALWEESRKEHPVTWTEWRDPSGYAGSVRSFESIGLPTFVLVSPEGVVLEVVGGFSESLLNSLISR